MAERYAPSSLQGAPPDALKARVEAVLGRRWIGWSRPTTGLSPAHRFLAALDQGSSVFVKAATTPQTAAWLRTERQALAVAPSDCTPDVIAWIEDDLPVLIVESFGDAYWPVRGDAVQWRAGDLERVVAAIARLAAAPAPESVPRMSSLPATAALRRRSVDNWATLLANLEGFDDLRLCSPRWIAANGAALAEAEAGLVLDGDSLVHGDLRSDNICLTDDRVIFVDWAQAARGAAETDLAIFLPSAHLEGGPAPFDIMPAGAGWAAQQSGELALRAIRDKAAPTWLVRVFRRLARINLDWAVASLGLPPRDA